MSDIYEEIRKFAEREKAEAEKAIQTEQNQVCIKADSYVAKEIKYQTALLHQILNKLNETSCTEKKTREGREMLEGRTARGMRTKKKKKNNVVILISAENDEELKAIEEEFLLSARRAARKRELGYYIAPVEIALHKLIPEQQTGMEGLREKAEEFAIEIMEKTNRTQQEVAILPQLLELLLGGKR